MDIILLFAAEEADLPKIEEVRPSGGRALRLLRRAAQICAAGADLNVKDQSGKTPMARAHALMRLL